MLHAEGGEYQQLLERLRSLPPTAEIKVSLRLDIYMCVLTHLPGRRERAHGEAQIGRRLWSVPSGHVLEFSGRIR